VPIGAVWLMAFVLIYFSGGAQSDMLTWLLIVPVISLVLLSNRSQLFWLLLTLVSGCLLSVVPAPHSQWVYISPWPVLFNITLFIGLILMVYMLVKTFKKQQVHLLTLSEKQNEELRSTDEELRQSLEELSATQDRLSEQNFVVSNRQKKTNVYLHTLIDLATCKGILNGDLQEAYSEILSVTVRVLGTSRISIWCYKSEENLIECTGIYDGQSRNASIGTKLYAKDLEPYFSAILHENIVVADDARTHLATACLSNSYLESLQIYSMLDVPYFENGKFEGIICCEQQYVRRSWDQEDVTFVKSVADLLSMAMNSYLRKQAEVEITLQREKITEQHDELLRYASEISMSNELLESRVQERTKELYEQNKKLTEYAFVNAHLLRGPLSRIMGLADVISAENSMEEVKKLVALLDVSAKELDEVVYRITTILHEGRSIDRDSIKK
jgi:GAF domain